MYRLAHRIVNVKLEYRGVTAEGVAAVRRLVQSDNRLFGFVDTHGKGSMVVTVDLQPGVTVEELETAIERKLACSSDHPVSV